jgi:soluble lytic murein transglycosylase
VEKWLDERRAWDLDVFIEGIPYDETRKYTQSVLGRWLAYRVLYGEGDDPLARVPYLDLKLPSA